VRLDFESDATESYALNAKSTAQEPVFVPRNASAPDGDGYLLALVNRFETIRVDIRNQGNTRHRYDLIGNSQ
jgi:carotenoid cleavage dioxygenase